MQLSDGEGCGPYKIHIWSDQFGWDTERRALRSMKLGVRMKSSSRCEAKAGWGEQNKAS